MTDFFEYDNGVLELTDCSILLLREFKALMDRDKTKGRTKLMKELTYIYLAICWKSPYNNYTEQERHEEALSDSGLTEKEFNDPVFREACKKFRALQDSNKSIRLLEAAKKAADQLTDYFDVIVDLNERDVNGKPVFSAEKFMKEVGQLSKVHEELVHLEKEVKESVTQQSETRGGVSMGYDPGNI